MDRLYFNQSSTSKWNFVYLFLLISGAFIAIGVSLVRLQVVEGSYFAQRAGQNEVQLHYEYPQRGVIYDRNNVLLAENIPAVELFIDLSIYLDNEYKLDSIKLKNDTDKIESIIGQRFYGAENNQSLHQFLVSRVDEYETEGVLPGEVLIAYDLNNDATLKIKSSTEFEALRLVEGSRRYYPAGIEFTHIVGYTGTLTAEDLGVLDYLDYEEVIALNAYNDSVGRLGLERYYDETLSGKKGIIAKESGAFATEEDSSQWVVNESEDGSSLHTSLDIEAQKKMYSIIEAYVKEHNATGGVGLLMDVETGDLVVAVTDPTYDNNRFIGGISYDEYNLLLNDPTLPLFNRFTSAQLPPGSTFKTLTLLGAYDAGAINENTIYVSRNDYTFSNGAKFQEYRDSAYGPLNLYTATAKSSNIFFCETIRNWSIYDLVPYYESFGIGSVTGIDIYGEAAGRLPSPENKKLLASDPRVTWLEPIWYPEGDGCNTVIGQGITLVTPLQMSRWMAAIANDGYLVTPRFVNAISNNEGKVSKLEGVKEEIELENDETLEVVRKAMWEAVNGSSRSIVALDGAKFEVAAKTGTAEFGALNSKGVYEHTHAWVTGFFPYDNPKYSFVVLLEDGGESFYAASAAREFIDWFADYCANDPTLCE